MGRLQDKVAIITGGGSGIGEGRGVGTNRRFEGGDPGVEGVPACVTRGKVVKFGARPIGKGEDVGNRCAVLVLECPDLVEPSLHLRLPCGIELDGLDVRGDGVDGVVDEG